MSVRPYRAIDDQYSLLHVPGPPAKVPGTQSGGTVVEDLVDTAAPSAEFTVSETDELTSDSAPDVQYSLADWVSDAVEWGKKKLVTGVKLVGTVLGSGDSRPDSSNDGDDNNSDDDVTDIFVDCSGGCGNVKIEITQ